MRRGEILGLEWSRVDFHREVIWVKRTKSEMLPVVLKSKWYRPGAGFGNLGLPARAGYGAVWT